jgi:hypothetical protein
MKHHFKHPKTFSETVTRHRNWVDGFFSIFPIFKPHRSKRFAFHKSGMSIHESLGSQGDVPAGRRAENRNATVPSGITESPTL